MSDNHNIIKSFYGEYKNGMFSKKKKVVLNIYEKGLEGIGENYFKEDLCECNFNIGFQNIRKIQEKTIQNYKSLVIEYINEKYIITTVVLPNLDNISEAICIIKNKIMEDKKAKLEQELEQREKQLIEENMMYATHHYNINIGDE